MQFCFNGVLTRKYVTLKDDVVKPREKLYFIADLTVGIPLLFVFRKRGTGVRH